MLTNVSDHTQKKTTSMYIGKRFFFCEITNLFKSKKKNEFMKIFITHNFIIFFFVSCMMYMRNSFAAYTLYHSGRTQSAAVTTIYTIHVRCVWISLTHNTRHLLGQFQNNLSVEGFAYWMLILYFGLSCCFFFTAKKYIYMRWPNAVNIIYTQTMSSYNLSFFFIIKI